MCTLDYSTYTLNVEYTFLCKIPFLLCCSDTKCVAGVLPNFDNACLKASKAHCFCENLICQQKILWRICLVFCPIKMCSRWTCTKRAALFRTLFSIERTVQRVRTQQQQKKINEFMCWRLCNVFVFSYVECNRFWGLFALWPHALLLYSF